VKTSGDSTLEKAVNTPRQWQSFDRASMLTAATERRKCVQDERGSSPPDEDVAR
jgi:hypothetical protein